MNRDSRHIAGREAEQAERIMLLVMRKIEDRRLAQARFLAWMSGTVGILCLAGFVPAVEYFASSASRSGFFEYASLLISDTGSIMRSWQVFIVSMADSAPIAGIIAVTALVFVLAASARSLARSMALLSMRRV